MRGNAIRLDGSISDRRAAIERTAVNGMRRNLYITMLMVLLPANMLAYVVHTEIIPLSLGMDAMLTFRVSDDAWKASLKDSGVEDSYDRWQTNQSGPIASSDLRERKSLVWKAWPLVCATGAGWLLLSAITVKHIFVGSVRQLAKDVEYRAEQYVTRDITRFVDRELAALHGATGPVPH